MRLNMNSESAARLSEETASTGVKFFSLKKDGDSARVRILYENMDNIPSYGVHSVKKDGRYASINCLRDDYDDPADMCPFCACDNPDIKKLSLTLWIPIYNVDTGDISLWQRSDKFYNNVILPLMVKHGEPFCGNIFTIVRHGEPGDFNTRYDIIHESTDDAILDDFDEIPSPEGAFLFNYNEEEMKRFLETGSFEEASVDGATVDIPDLKDRRRRTTDDSENSGGVSRRTSRPNMV